MPEPASLITRYGMFVVTQSIASFTICTDFSNADNDASAVRFSCFFVRESAE